MYTAKRMPFRVAMPFAWRAALFFASYSFTVCALYSWVGWTLLAIPFIPVATIGAALAFDVGFKNYSFYERLWEARHIWSNLISASRSWGFLSWIILQTIQTVIQPLICIEFNRY